MEKKIQDIMSLDILLWNNLVFRKIEGGQLFPKCPHDSPPCAQGWSLWGGGGGGVTPQGVFSDTIKIAMGEPPHTKNFKMATKWGEMMQIY